MANINVKRIEVIVYRKTKAGNRFLILKRSENIKYPNIWQMVSGTIDTGEKAYQTATRELKEETGIVSDELYVLPRITEFYNFVDDDSVSLAPVFLAKVTTDKITLSDEHSEYKWVDFHKAYKILHWVQWKENVFFAEKILKNKLLYKALQKIEIK